MMKNKWKGLVVIIAFLVIAEGTPSPLQASSYDAQFYSNLQEIVVDTVAIRQGDEKNSVPNKSFPIESTDILNSVISAVNKEIKIKPEIKIETPQEAGGGYDYGDNKSPDKIYMHVKLTYWDSRLLDPELNHDVIIVSIRTKRNIREYSITGEATLKAREKLFEPFLISVPEDESNLRAHIQNALERNFARKFIYLNCINNRNCDSVAK